MIDEELIRAVMRASQSDPSGTEGGLKWRTIIPGSPARLSHREGLDIVAIPSPSSTFEERPLAGPITWHLSDKGPILGDDQHLFFQSSMDLRKRVTGFYLELLEAISDGLLRASLAKAIAEEWEETWKGGDRRLSKEQQRGLFGELLILRNLIAHRGEQSVSWWAGPENGLHDFDTPDILLEVKTHGRTSQNIRVSGLKQLEPPSKKPLKLACIGIGRKTGGQTLPEIVLQIQDVLSDDIKQIFFSKLDNAGYFDHHSGYYLAAYEVVSIHVGPITPETSTLHRAKLKEPNPALLEALYSLDSSMLSLEKTDLEGCIYSFSSA
jgi:hypothetical protein